ncbi:MAG: hypothetical protein Q7T82_09445 [Armatimonadota bacterium]|nr:hypothetical protein [Armatimonadota bacterium]
MTSKERAIRKAGSGAALALTIVVCATILLAGPAQCVYRMTQNEYISVKLGAFDDNVYNLVPCRYSFGAVLGDPETPGDDGGDMIYYNSLTPRDSHGYAVIRINDLGKDIIIGDTSQGGWALAPFVVDDGQAVRGDWLMNQSNGSILVKMRIDLRRDMARMEYKLTNTDAVRHEVGLRLSWDEMLLFNDGPDAVAPGYGSIPAETEYTSQAVPTYIDYFDDLNNPTMVARNLFKGQDTTPPDKVVVAQWGPLVSTLWNYTIVPDRPITDRATSAWWNALWLTPNQTRTIVTYFGVGVATSDLRYPFGVSIQGPRALQYDEGAVAGLSPDEFTVNSYLYNFYHDLDLSRVSFYLSLPDGLQFAPGETPTKTLTAVGPESEGKVSWSIKPTGDVAGELVYSITASGAGVTAKTVRRSVVVPLTQSLRYVYGLQMVSIPFNFSDPTPEAAFGTAPGDVQLYHFDPALNTYVEVDTLTPGEGYWLRSNIVPPSGQNWAPVSLSGAVPLAGDSTFQIRLKGGWNMFGNPYVYNITWGRIQVLNERLPIPEVVSLETATQRGWIRPTVFWYDTAARAYGRSSDRTTQLVPGRGYWLKALVPCKLVIPPIDQLGAAIITGSP